MAFSLKGCVNHNNLMRFINCCLIRGVPDKGICHIILESFWPMSYKWTTSRGRTQCKGTGGTPSALYRACFQVCCLSDFIKVAYSQKVFWLWSLSKKSRISRDLAPFLSNGTKVKIPSEIKPPLVYPAQPGGIKVEWQETFSRDIPKTIFYIVKWKLEMTKF